MNRVYLVASDEANMAAKVQEVMDAASKAGLIAAAYNPLNVVSAADAVADIKAGKTAALMEKICADFLKQDFDAVDAVVVEGASSMSAVVAQKFNESLATALDAKVFADGEDADCSALAACSSAKSALLLILLIRLANARQARPCSVQVFF